MSDLGGGGDPRGDYERRRDPSSGYGGRPYDRSGERSGDRPFEEPFAGSGERGYEPGGRTRSAGQGARRRSGEGRGARSSSGSSAGSGGGLYGSDVGGNLARTTVAEIVGTFILVFTGTAVAVAANLNVPIVGESFDSLAVALAFGLILAALVAALGHVSGAHLNPAVTLGLAATRKLPWRYVPAYLVAQLVGAILAAFATWITLGGQARSGAGLAAPTLSPGVGIFQGFFVEALITFILVFVVISVATDDRVDAGVAPIAVGFALAAGVFIGGPITGGSVNPARALGPIIVAWRNWDTSLIYILAPIVGGVLAALLYDRFIAEAEAP